jgi:hypothetical protein
MSQDLIHHKEIGNANSVHFFEVSRPSQRRVETKTKSSIVSSFTFVSALAKGMPRSLVKVIGSLALAASIGATAPAPATAAARQSSIVVDV